MSLFALVVVLMKRFLKSKTGYWVIAIIALTLGFFCVTLQLTAPLLLAAERITYGDVALTRSYTTMAEGFLLPLGVFALVSAIWQPKRFPLIPTLIVSVAAGFLFSSFSSLIDSLALNAMMFSGGSATALTVTAAVMRLHAYAVIGLCATSWIQYIQVGGGEPLPTAEAAENSAIAAGPAAEHETEDEGKTL